MAKAKILLVDDRPDGLITLEAVLSNPHYELYRASSGTEALAQVLEHNFSAIILDVQMPLMDGFETARHIRQRERSKETPILFVTAISKDNHFIQKGYESGAVDYIFKPFDPYVLKAKVAVFVELFEKNAQLKAQAEELRASEAWTRLLIDTAGDMISTVASDGTFTSISPAFEKITGLKRSEWIGKRVEKLVHPSDLGLFLKNFQKCLEGGDCTAFEMRCESLSVQWTTLECSLRPIPSPQSGAKRELLLVARDVSERKRAQREEQRRRELERSNQELEQFAHACSHDLKEPLRMVASYSQLLEQMFHDELGSQGKKYIDYISENAHRMSKLIKDLLEYSCYGGSELPVEKVSLEGPVNDALNNLKGAIDSNHAVVDVGELPAVLGNSSQLTRLFQNLFANSIKFHQKEPPVLKVDARMDGDDCVVAVKDNGIGFDMRHASSIFLVFRRLHGRDKFDGSGVGLSICKKIVENHGGKIWVESEPGKGSTFYFTLRRAHESRARAG